MPSKPQFYLQLAAETASSLTESLQRWTAFLETSARLYKYPYYEQLLIFAQKPEATACAGYEVWNDTMHRFVRRGSKGIALLDSSGDNPRIKYVFDVSDTGGGANARRPFLWEYRPEHQESVGTALEERFGSPGRASLALQLEAIAGDLIESYWEDHGQDILRIVDGSFLEEYDEDNLRASFHHAGTVSTAYMLMSRCGLDPSTYFTHEDFLPVFDFNTPETIGALGSAISEASEQVLRQIEVTIKRYEREHRAERTESHERTAIQDERRLPDSRSEPERDNGNPAGQVRENAENLSEGAYRPVLFSNLLLTEQLYSHLREIDREAQNRLETMMPRLMQAAGITEKMKAENPMQWVGLMNNCKAQAEETILSELIYS